jgi:hypothetical protein
LGYSNLEYDLDQGRRGLRLIHAEKLLCRLAGAEAALVVNNNAAAVLLALTALARRRAVVIARSQLVEIGGGFRVPEVMNGLGAPGGGGHDQPRASLRLVSCPGRTPFIVHARQSFKFHHPGLYQ